MSFFRKAGLFLYLISLIPVSTYGQDQVKADSIKASLETLDLADSEKLEPYYWLSIYSSAPEERLKYGKDLLKLSNDLENLEFKIRANRCIGVSYRFLGNLDTAVEYLFESANDAWGKEEFLPILAEIYAELSTCYTQNGDSENALLYGSKTVDILRKTNEKQLLALTLLNVGFDYYVTGKYDSALAYYNESEPILREIEMEHGLAYIVGNRALVFWKTGSIERSKKDLFEAIDRLKSLGDIYAIADYNNQLANIYFEENQMDQATLHANEGFELAKADGFKEQARDAAYLLFLIARERGEYKEALANQTIYHAYKDSIQNLETTQRIADLRTEFEVSQKQAEVDLLVGQKQTIQTILIIAGIGFVSFACLILVRGYSTSANLSGVKKKGI